MKEPQLPKKTLDALAKVFAGYPELAEVVLFGSRATGTATPRSDIDLATRGIVTVEYHIVRLLAGGWGPPTTVLQSRRAGTR